ncbi:MAG: phosphoribosylglycinamide formyltransferase [Saprospiraceae bacterium]|nr:phosphoribosylglycinamide formyltransferase [Saprospiraceae bacterium]
MVRIAIFASGGGSNAEKIIHYFERHPTIKIALVVSNNKNAGVLDIARKNRIKSEIISKSDFYENNALSLFLISQKIDFIILAGFLWLLPAYLTSEYYPNKILNIHPSFFLNMEEMECMVIMSMKQSKDDQSANSGMTVHLVNEKYDEGEIIFQRRCQLSQDMNATEIAAEVLKLEHKYFSAVIENYITTHINRLK